MSETDPTTGLPDDGDLTDLPDDSADLDAKREEALRVGLAEYELEDDDLALLHGELGDGDDEGPSAPLPVLAVVGRPNVGKSTLVNRIIGRREAVVEDKPGVTRDRVSYPAEWAGRRFTLVDTGGWETNVKGMAARVAEQAEIAIDLADAVLFVVDATVGPTSTDERVVKLLRSSGKPVVLCANKVDGPRVEADATELWSLGLGEPHPVSALHGRGTGDLLDAAMAALPTVSAHGAQIPEGGPRRVALVGRPNVGKSSLLNKVLGSERVVVDATAGTTRDPVDELVQLKGKPWWFVDTAGIRRRVHQTAGADRVVVDAIAGTTRDPVDEVVEVAGRPWRFVDTAGIRRRVHQTQGADFYASLRTQAAIEKAEVAVVLVDASVKLTEQDTRVITQVVDAGRALVIAYNKWDLMDEDRRLFLEREIEKDLVQVQWAPRINFSAKTGWHTDRLVPALEQSLESWGKRISTGRLNAFLGELVAGHPHPLRGGKQPRILFATQAATCPPRFVIFATGFIEAGYRRYIERRLRETFGFEGTPISISVRVREKRKR